MYGAMDAGRGCFVWSRSAAEPLMYRKRNGVFGCESTMAWNPASVLVWQTRRTSAKSWALDLVGVIATVLTVGQRPGG